MDTTLDETHAKVLKELDRQIDLLSHAPLSSPLPPFPENISFSQPSPAQPEAAQGTHTRDVHDLCDLSFALKRDLADFERLAREPLEEQEDLSLSFDVSKIIETKEAPDMALFQPEQELIDPNRAFLNSNASHSAENLGPEIKEDGSFAILKTLKALQDRIQILEREKSESSSRIQGLEKELLNARQILFHKQATSEASQSSVTARKDKNSGSGQWGSNTSFEKVSAIRDMQSSWIQDARNEVAQLRERVQKEKKRQKERRDSLQDAQRPILMDMDIQPPQRAHVKSPGGRESPVNVTRIPDVQLENSFIGYQEVERLRSEIEAERILKERKSRVVATNDAKKELEAHLKKIVVPTGQAKKPKQPAKLPMREKLKAHVSQPPSWQKVEGRPKSAPAAAVKKRVLSHNSGSKSNLALERDLPFTVGQNPGKSYSVTANLQTVYSLLKSHNPTLCNTCSKKTCDRTCKGYQKATVPSKPEVKFEPRQETVVKKKLSKPTPFKPAEKAPTVASSDVLGSSLSTLEKEFRDLRQEYDYLVAKYDTALKLQPQQAGTLRAIGDSLKEVIQAMETKGDQIAILKQIVSGSKASTKAPKKLQTARAVKEHISKPNPELLKSQVSSISPSRAMESLGLLKSSMVVQNALAQVG